jgi:hypothetical protein
MKNLELWHLLTIAGGYLVAIFGIYLKLMVKQKEQDMSIAANEERIETNRRELQAHEQMNERAFSKLDGHIDKKFDEVYKKLDNITNHLISK